MTGKKALQVLIDNLEYPCDKEYDIVWNALNQLEELEKVLKIIKEKKVNVGDFIRCETVDDYNDYCCYGDDERLTELDFILLKEYLK